MVNVIYKITCGNERLYIGSAKNAAKRRRQHLNSLRNNTHHNDHLQRAFNKYGEPAYLFEIIEEVADTDAILEREQYWIDSFPRSQLFNLCPVAGSPIGRPIKQSTRDKLSRSGKLRPPISDETRRLISESKRGERNYSWGKHPSEETRRKLSESRKGERHYMYGKKMPDSTKAKLSFLNSGERNPNYGKTRTPAQLQDMSESRGKPVVQLDKITGEEIAVWRCASDAGYTLGISRSDIGAVCNARTFTNGAGRVFTHKTAGGYGWEFA